MDKKCADCNEVMQLPYGVCWECEKPLHDRCGNGKEKRCTKHYKSWVLRGKPLFEGYKRS